jgi:hypothetical protein
MLEDYKNAKDQEMRYYHVDLMAEFINSWKAPSPMISACRAAFRKR